MLRGLRNCRHARSRTCFQLRARRLPRSLRPCGLLRAHSSPCPHQISTRHPQVGQCEQRDQLRRVLGQASVPHLGEAELLLDHAERMLDLGADAGLHLLHALGDEVLLKEGVELLVP